MCHLPSLKITIHMALCGYSSNHSIQLLQNILAEELQFYFLKYKFIHGFPFSLKSKPVKVQKSQADHKRPRGHVTILLTPVQVR